MLSRRKRRDAEAISTLVGKETRVHGDVEFTGGCLVDGYVKGNVKSINSETAMLSVSERGVIEGSVMVPNLLLNGTIKGDVKASRRVELGSNARVIGNVQYGLIEMAIGAQISGKLIHESESGKRPQVADSVQPTPAEEPAEPVQRVSPVAKVNIVGE